MRFNRPTHLINAISFAVAQVLIAGVNLYALALILDALLGADDERVAEGEQSEKRSKAARLFDVRRVIGALFVIYGVIITLIGIFDDQAEIDKAQGVRINLWMGLAMLVLGGLFLLWMWWRPIEVAPTPDVEDETGPKSPAEN